jgi:hypothetical protein
LRGGYQEAEIVGDTLEVCLPQLSCSIRCCFCREYHCYCVALFCGTYCATYFIFLTHLHGQLGTKVLRTGSKVTCLYSLELTVLRQ